LSGVFCKAVLAVAVMCVCRQCGFVAFASLKIALFIQPLKKGTTHFLLLGRSLFFCALRHFFPSLEVRMRVRVLYYFDFITNNQLFLVVFSVEMHYLCTNF
jgi:hypothetical protein